MSSSRLSSRIFSFFNIAAQLSSSSKPRLWQKSQLDTNTIKMVGGTALGSTAFYTVVTPPAHPQPKPEDADQKAHHVKNGKGFVNPWDSYKHSTLMQYFTNNFRRKLAGLSRTPDTTAPPIVTPTFLPTRDTPKLRATWLGHACYYVEFPSGLRVLFDPVFEDCCAPIAMKHLRRHTPPACQIEDLPFVDLVVISHNHYDHLSYPSIKRIQAKFPDAHFFAPLGNKRWFEDSGVKSVTELDWWESRDVRLETRKGVGEEQEQEQGQGRVDSLDGGRRGVQVQVQAQAQAKEITAMVGALPCQHVTARGAFDKCKTLWASWSVESGGAKLFFAGDTGYRTVPPLPPSEDDDYAPKYASLPICPAFTQIGTLRGPFSLGLIPIGAYAPREVHSATHANPKDAVNIFLDTKCRKALAMHWGTWVLTEEDLLEPPRLLREGLRWKGVREEGVFDVLDVGGSREVDS